MKKISKKLIAFFIVTTLLTSMIGSVAFAATSYRYGGVGLNISTTGYITITSTGATAATGCDATTAQVDVRLTYYYTDRKTGKTTSNITSTNGYVGSTSTSLTIPSTTIYKSSSATSTHRVWYNSQFWSADNAVTY
jgi:hypothetical protein